MDGENVFEMMMVVNRLWGDCFQSRQGRERVEEGTKLPDKKVQRMAPRKFAKTFGVHVKYFACAKTNSVKETLHVREI